MNFEDQIKKAIDRGRQTGQISQEASRAAQLTQDELKRRHSAYRLELSEYIEQTLRKVPNLVPGFSFETVYGDRGWGGAIARDDIQRGGTFYSRLELSVRPAGEYGLLTIVGRGTIKNREVLSWNHFAEIADVETNAFKKLIDAWILQYIEMFSGT
ncbi:MAG: hypothetical protein ABL888_09990 [Pirellulaceae bacterium]